MPETNPIRDRIIGYRKIARATLIPHPAHCWEHPAHERDQLRAKAGTTGSTSALLVRAHPTKGDYWEVIDGKMRMEELSLPELSCLICDLNDEEAERETREHNLLPQFAFTEDPALNRVLDELKARLPDVGEMLNDAPKPDPVVGSAAAEADAANAEQVKKERKEIKPQAPATYSWVLCGIPVNDWGKAQPHVAALQAMSAVTVQAAGEGI